MSDIEPVWAPDRPPRMLLPPYIEPEFSLAELCDLSIEEYEKEYYLRSGRYLGIYESREEAEKADAYRYARKFAPGGRMPWE